MTITEISDAFENWQCGNTQNCVYYENRQNFVDINKDGELIIVSTLNGFSSSIYRLDGTIEEDAFFVDHA